MDSPHQMQSGQMVPMAPNDPGRMQEMTASPPMPDCEQAMREAMSGRMSGQVEE